MVHVDAKNIALKIITLHEEAVDNATTVKTLSDIISAYKSFWEYIKDILKINDEYIYIYVKSSLGGDAFYAKGKIIMVGKNGEIVGALHGDEKASIQDVYQKKMIPGKEYRNAGSL